MTSSLPDLEFGPEWALLELLCLGLTMPILRITKKGEVC